VLLAMVVNFYVVWGQDGSNQVLAGQNPSSAPLSITTESLPAGATHTHYKFQLATTGGTAPVEWKLTKGTLPPGLQLDASSGTIAGTPDANGESTFTVQAADSGKPPQTATHDFVIKITLPLTLEWKSPALVNGGGIQGAVEVSNGTDDNFDLTVIVVAVNDMGRATALGYQHFNLGKDGKQDIPFGSSLPPGQYTVHVDAVAEVPDKDTIYRRRLQTPQPLVRTGTP